MANSVQVLRTNTAGTRPTARKPGEPYYNGADRQFGIYDGAPNDLLAIRFFSTTTTYAVGDHTVESGTLYRCEIAVSIPGPFTPANWTEIGKPLPVAPASIGDTPPPAPVPGSLWWNSTSMQLFIYYFDGTGPTGQWVIANR